MARVPLQKTLVNARLLKDYASWVYCTGCNQTVAYLCYTTYDRFDFDFTCRCGSHGSVHIAFTVADAPDSDAPLVSVKNRLCCPDDQSPLVTFVEKSLVDYRAAILCKPCGQAYHREYHQA